MTIELQHFSAETKRFGLRAGFRPPFSGVNNVGDCWVGKMCCKAPCGKYAKSISKRQKTKSKSGKVSFEFRK